MKIRDINFKMDKIMEKESEMQIYRSFHYIIERE